MVLIDVAAVTFSRGRRDVDIVLRKENRAGDRGARVVHADTRNKRDNIMSKNSRDITTVHNTANTREPTAAAAASGSLTNLLSVKKRGLQILILIISDLFHAFHVPSPFDQ